MPTIFREGPYRIYFYSHEPNEPPHVHVDRESFSARFWLGPVGLANNYGFSPRELRKLERLLFEKQKEFMEAWNGYFGTSRR